MRVVPPLDSHKDADAMVTEFLFAYPSILKSTPHLLQQESLTRIHLFGVARRHTKEPGIKLIDAVNPSADQTPTRGETRTVSRHRADSGATCDHLMPKLINVGGSGKPTAETDDVSRNSSTVVDDGLPRRNKKTTIRGQRQHGWPLAGRDLGALRRVGNSVLMRNRSGRLIGKALCQFKTGTIAKEEIGRERVAHNR